jgi:hypothetical protein
MSKVAFPKIATTLGLVAAFVALAALASPALAQKHPCGQHGKHMGMRMYDPFAEMTLNGTVEKVWTEECGCCADCAGGTHFMLQMDGETMEVHLGPASLFAKNDWELERGDEIEVLGSKVSFRDGEALIAREVTKGGETLTLRNEQGIPVWSRGRGPMP